MIVIRGRIHWQMISPWMSCNAQRKLPIEEELEGDDGALCLSRLPAVSQLGQTKMMAFGGLWPDRRARETR
jgi:hypothetical protein